VSESRPDAESVQEAAEHAAHAVQEHEQMRRTAAEAQAADGGAQQAALEHESTEHRQAAEFEEAEADEAAREADGA
jgi:hypothetical protein